MKTIWYFNYIPCYLKFPKSWYILKLNNKNTHFLYGLAFYEFVIKNLYSVDVDPSKFNLKKAASLLCSFKMIFIRIFIFISVSFICASFDQQFCKSFVDYSAKRACALYDTKNCGSVKRFPIDCPIIELKSRYPCTRYICEDRTTSDRTTTTATTTTSSATAPTTTSASSSTTSASSSTTSALGFSLGKTYVDDSDSSFSGFSPVPSCNKEASVSFSIVCAFL